MTNPGGTKTASNLPISVDPHGARINDSLALVSLPSHCLWDELWSGVGVPQRRPFLPISIRLPCCMHDGHGPPMFAVRAPPAIASPSFVYRVMEPAPGNPARAPEGSGQDRRGMSIFTLRRSLYAW